MNLNIKKVSVPVLMFLMAQSGFGVSNENFGNANRALGQSNLNRAVRCLTDEAIKKDEANSDDDFTELRKLLVNKDESALKATIKEIGELLKSAYTEYLVPRNNANAVRNALKDLSAEDLRDKEKRMAALVDTNLFTKYKDNGEKATGDTGKYLWWTIDGYDDAPEGTIKWKFNQVVEEILGKTTEEPQTDNWQDINPTGQDAEAQAQANKKTNADLLLRAIAYNSIGDLIAADFEGTGWWTYDNEIEKTHTAAGEKWNSVLTEINDEIYTVTGGQRTRKTDDDINKESIIDALQVFLGDRLMEKLIKAGETEEGNVGEALENFFEGHFMRKVTGGEEQDQDISETSFENALREVNDIMSDAAGDDNDKKERIYNVTFDAIYDRIEGLLRSKDAPVSIDMFKDGGIFSDTFKKTLVNQLDNLDSTERKWEKIGVAEDGPLANLRDQIKRIVWIDDDDNDVAGAKESDNESYDYDSSDIIGGDSDEEQAERAEEAVKEGLENADKLIDNQQNPQP